jgi:hypothetical protein
MNGNRQSTAPQGGPVTKSTVTVTALISVCLMALVGCGGNDSGGGSSTPGAPRPPAPQKPNPIIGKWQSPCQDADLFGLSQNSALSVVDGKMLRLTRYHSTGTCTEESVEVLAEASYNKGSDVRTNVAAIDITIQKIVMKPISEMGVTLLKTSAFCGQTEWVLGEPKDVTAFTGKTNCYPKVPQTMFDIFSIDGEKLYFGKGTDISTPAKRPTEINIELPYTKL